MILDPEVSTTHRSVFCFQGIDSGRGRGCGERAGAGGGGSGAGRGSSLDWCEVVDVACSLLMLASF